MRIRLLCHLCGDDGNSALHAVHGDGHVFQLDRIEVATEFTDLGPILDALRFARDEFIDGNGSTWSDEEYAVVDRWATELNAALDEGITDEETREAVIGCRTEEVTR